MSYEGVKGYAQIVTKLYNPPFASTPLLRSYVVEGVDAGFPIPLPMYDIGGIIEG